MVVVDRNGWVFVERYVCGDVVKGREFEVCCEVIVSGL